ncbi:MAG: HDOD domain-containing protein [Nitrospinae bacterium]|nr:HDOD domain-containing protein [Nitrospinota bacterium]
MSRLEQQQILEFVDKLPGFSPAALKIISLANNPNTSPTELVNAISMDPMLTAKMLKLVNSAYFGSRGVASLNRAVMLLGFNTVKNISLSLAVVGGIRVRGEFKWFTNDQFWEHCLACAIVTKSLAKKMNVGALEVEEFFVAGLVHDMGLAALIQKMPKEMGDIYDPSYQPERPRHNVEKEMLGFSHPELSGLIARRWKFPPSLVAAIEHHHDPLAAPEEHRRLAAAVHLADSGCHSLKIGIQTEINIGNITKEELAAAGLEPDQVEESLVGLPEAVEGARFFLEKVD